MKLQLVICFLVIISLAGCQRAVNPSEIISKAATNLNNLESYQFKQDDYSVTRLNPIHDFEQPPQYLIVTINITTDLKNQRQKGFTNVTTRAVNLEMSENTEYYQIDGSLYFRKFNQYFSENWTKTNAGDNLDNLTREIAKQMQDVTVLNITAQDDVYIIKSKSASRLMGMLGPGSEVNSEITYYISKDLLLPLRAEYKIREIEETRGTVDSNISIAFKNFNSDFDIRLPEGVEV